MSYAIIALGGKQYRVREGQRLLVDRLAVDEGETLNPTVLMVGGNGDTQLAPENAVVTARVVGHVLGDKIRIGKYKAKKGYRRHAGFRAKLSQIEIAEIGTGGEGQRPARRSAKAAVTPEPVREPPPVAEPEPHAAEAAAPGELPPGYESMTVVQIAGAAGDWGPEALSAALEYERAHAGRKGALAALQAAIAAIAAEEEE